MADSSTLAMSEALSILLIMLGFCILPVLAVGGLALIRRFERAPDNRNAATKRGMDQLERRIAGLETGHGELARMQERLDFLEAVLEGGPPRPQLPGAGEADGKKPASR